MLSEITNKIPYPIVGSVPASFEIPFRYFEKSEIKVLWSLDQTARPGVAPIVLNEGDDYELSEPDETGILTRVGTWDTAGIKLTVYREVELKQKVDLRNGDKYDADKVENMGDYIMAAVQQVKENISRTVRIPITDDSDIDLVYPPQEERAGHSTSFDATGKNMIVSDRDLIGCTPFMETLCDDPDAATARETLGITEGELTGTLAEDVSAGDAVSLTENGWEKCKRTIGSPETIDSGTNATDRLKSFKWGNKFISLFSSDDASGQGELRIGHVDSTYGIVFDCAVTLFSTAAHNVSHRVAFEINDTYFGVYYHDSTDGIDYVRIGHLSGGAVVWDTAVTDAGIRTYDSYMSYLQACGLDPATNSFVVCMGQTANTTGYYPCAVRVGHLSGSSVVWDTVATGAGTLGRAMLNEETEFAMERLNYSEFILTVAYKDASANNRISAYLYSVSSSTLTEESSHLLAEESGSTFIADQIGLCRLSDDSMFVYFKGVYSSEINFRSYMYVLNRVTINSGLRIILQTLPYEDYVFNLTLSQIAVNKDTGIIVLAAWFGSDMTLLFYKTDFESYVQRLSKPYVVGYYYDVGIISTGKDSFVVPYRERDASASYVIPIRFNEPIAISKETKSVGENCNIKYSGKLSGLTALEAGSDYVINWDTAALEKYSYDATFLPQKIGKAISATELLIGG